MRKNILLLIISLLPLLAWADKVYVLEQTPTELTIESVTHVEIIKSNRNEIVLDDSREQANQFIYKWEGTELILTRDKEYQRLSKHEYNKVTLYLTHPEQLKKIDVEEVSKLHYDAQTLHPRLELELDGVSTAELTGHFDRLEIEVSGVSKVNLEATMTRAEFDVSGTSALSVRGDFQVIEADISGVSKAKINGRGERAIISVSGMSNFNGADCIVKSGIISVAGMSKGSIHATESYSGSASGLSSVSNHGRANR